MADRAEDSAWKWLISPSSSGSSYLPAVTTMAWPKPRRLMKAMRRVKNTAPKTSQATTNGSARWSGLARAVASMRVASARTMTVWASLPSSTTPVPKPSVSMRTFWPSEGATAPGSGSTEAGSRRSVPASVATTATGKGPRSSSTRTVSRSSGRSPVSTTLRAPPSVRPSAATSARGAPQGSASVHGASGISATTSAPTRPSLPELTDTLTPPSSTSTGASSNTWTSAAGTVRWAW